MRRAFVELGQDRVAVGDDGAQGVHVAAGLGGLEADRGQEHFADSVDLRAVRILRAVASGVVLAVNRHPFLGGHPGREPQPEAEEVAGRRMQGQRAVRLVPMAPPGEGGPARQGLSKFPLLGATI